MTAPKPIFLSFVFPPNVAQSQTDDCTQGCDILSTESVDNFSGTTLARLSNSLGWTRSAKTRFDKVKLAGAPLTWRVIAGKLKFFLKAGNDLRESFAHDYSVGFAEFDPLNVPIWI